MTMVMCRSCGEFVTAVKDGGSLRPIRDRCLQCDGREFKDIDADRIVDAVEK